MKKGHKERRKNLCRVTNRLVKVAALDLKRWERERKKTSKYIRVIDFAISVINRSEKGKAVPAISVIVRFQIFIL